MIGGWCIHSQHICGTMPLWTWGSDGYGRLGLGTENRHQCQPQKVPALSDVPLLSLSVGAAHTIALACNGACFTWGKCHYGQLGQGEMDEDIHEPRPLAFPAGVVIHEVATGESHTMAITDEGCVYSWGHGYYGCLGHGSETSHSTPKLIEALKGVAIVTVCGGTAHSLAIASDGQMYVWGRDHMGQLGLPPYTQESKQVRLNQKTPAVLPLPVGTTAKMAAACGSHSLVLCATGDILSFGDNSHGQLGRCKRVTEGEGVDGCHVESSSFKGQPVVFVAAGMKHCAAIDSSGALFTWGWGRYGRLGTGSILNQATPAKVVTDNTFTQVACGESHTVALSSSGHVWAWGSAHYGKLGLSVDESSVVDRPRKVELNEEGKLIQCGTNHTVLYC